MMLHLKMSLLIFHSWLLELFIKSMGCENIEERVHTANNYIQITDRGVDEIRDCIGGGFASAGKPARTIV